MDIKQPIEYRYKDTDKYCFVDDNRYDYAKNGILNKILPKLLFKGNSIFVTFLQLIDLRCILLFKYIDKLKNFKNFMMQ